MLSPRCGLATRPLAPSAFCRRYHSPKQMPLHGIHEFHVKRQTKTYTPNAHTPTVYTICDQLKEKWPSNCQPCRIQYEYFLHCVWYGSVANVIFVDKNENYRRTIDQLGKFKSANQPFPRRSPIVSPISAELVSTFPRLPIWFFVSSTRRSHCTDTMHMLYSFWCSFNYVVEIDCICNINSSTKQMTVGVYLYDGVATHLLLQTNPLIARGQSHSALHRISICSVFWFWKFRSRSPVKHVEY